MGPISITDHRLRHASIHPPRQPRPKQPKGLPLPSLLPSPLLSPALLPSQISIQHLVCGRLRMIPLVICVVSGQCTCISYSTRYHLRYVYTVAFRGRTILCSACLCLVMNCKAVGQAAGWGLRAPTEDYAPLSCLQNECALVSSLCFFHGSNISFFRHSRGSGHLELKLW